MKTKPTLIKKQSLLTAHRVRAQKFNRVSQDFVNKVDSAVDAWLRTLAANTTTHDDFIPPTTQLYTPEAKEQVLKILNAKVGSIIHSMVKAHPSIGKTLKD